MEDRNKSRMMRSPVEVSEDIDMEDVTKSFLSSESEDFSDFDQPAHEHPNQSPRVRVHNATHSES
jgi:hypothetical protein